jgi:hypothetical protein
LTQSRFAFGLVDNAPAGTRDVALREVSLGLLESTFVGARDATVHRWYKLRPSFSPWLVRFLNERLSPTTDRRPLFDPYSGAGTTVIEGKKLGLDSYGIEINPFLAVYSKLALDWTAAPTSLQEARTVLRGLLEDELTRYRDLSIDQIVARTGVDIPKIHSPFRWWREDVLRDLLIVKSALKRCDKEGLALCRRLLWLTLGTECIEVANIKRLHPTLTFHDRSSDLINVHDQILRKLDVIVRDLCHVHELDRGTANLVNEGDTGSASAHINFTRPVNLITSPPYANRYSYVWETRPHLYMMELIDDRKSAADLDLAAPGGTWGTATSSLAKGIIEPKDALVGGLVNEVTMNLRRIDNLMANYVVKYFNTMQAHLAQIRVAVPGGSRFAIVVGNSRIKGVEVATESILAGMLQALPGTDVEELITFRRRIGRARLYETAIIGTFR